MPLIACPDCRREVSDRAPSCPYCGAPVALAAESLGSGVSLTTTQETSKRLKIHILIASILFWSGFGLAYLLTKAEGTPGWAGLVPLLITSGLVWYVVTKVRVWWHHK